MAGVGVVTEVAFVQSNTICDPKTVALTRVIATYLPRQPLRTLVVGCGSGIEAAVLAQELGGEVRGIDLAAAFDPQAHAWADLRQGDATALDADDGSFDLVFSYHVLEHIPQYRMALSEMHRVLKRGGTFMIGTPNRARVVGYIGSKDASLQQKFAWNTAEWVQRARGTFTNEQGAHAGFTAEELREMLLNCFTSARDVSREYYRALYASHPRLIGLLSGSGISRFTFPSVYFIGQR